MQCFNCGKTVRDFNNQRYFCNPTTIIVQCSYLVCEEHKNVRYDFDDIYDLVDGKPQRKENIDHEAIRRKSENKES